LNSHDGFLGGVCGQRHNMYFRAYYVLLLEGSLGMGEEEVREGRGNRRQNWAFRGRLPIIP